MRRWFALILTFIFISSLSAQEATWSAWFYDETAGQAWQVDSTGVTLNDVRLPVPALYAPDSFVFSRGLSVSYDGNRLAYSITGQDTTGASVTTFVVYDVPSDKVLTTFQPPQTPLADALSLSRRPHLFNLTGGAVAYSYATGDTAETQLWQIVVLDILTNNTLAEINNTNPAVEAQNFDANVAPFLLPQIYYYEGATVNFALVDFGGMALNQQFDNFGWDVITGRVTRTNQFSTVGGDYLPRIGESIIPIFDDRVVYDTNFAPYSNSLHVYRPDIGARAPFFASATLEIIRADFARDGQDVILQGRGLADNTATWFVVDRAGVAQAMPNFNALEGEILGTPTGFIHLLDGAPQIAVASVTGRPTIGSVALWVVPDGHRAMPVWATPPDPAVARAAWAQLAPPVFNAQVVIVPDENTGVTANEVATATPSGRGILTVNGVAIISTTEGDRLNMRNQPGLNSTIVARLENGTRVVILDGPVAGDGFTWWQVRLNTGLSGWVVESADGVRTLIPAG